MSDHAAFERLFARSPIAQAITHSLKTHTPLDPALISPEPRIIQKRKVVVLQHERDSDGFLTPVAQPVRAARRSTTPVTRRVSSGSYTPSTSSRTPLSARPSDNSPTILRPTSSVLPLPLQSPRFYSRQVINKQSLGDVSPLAVVCNEPNSRIHAIDQRNNNEDNYDSNNSDLSDRNEDDQGMTVGQQSRQLMNNDNKAVASDSDVENNSLSAEEELVVESPVQKTKVGGLLARFNSLKSGSTPSTPERNRSDVRSAMEGAPVSEANITSSPSKTYQNFNKSTNHNRVPTSSSKNNNQQEGEDISSDEEFEVADVTPVRLTKSALTPKNIHIEKSEVSIQIMTPLNSKTGSRRTENIVNESHLIRSSDAVVQNPRIGGLVNASKVDQFFSPGRDQSVSVVELEDWYPVPLLSSKTLAVAGHKMATPQEELWRSTAIKERVNQHVVMTASGTMYILKGRLNKEATIEEGFTATFSNQFVLGFPPNWERVLSRFYSDYNKNQNRTEQAVKKNKRKAKPKKIKTVKGKSASDTDSVGKKNGSKKKFTQLKDNAISDVDSGIHMDPNSLDILVTPGPLRKTQSSKLVKNMSHRYQDAFSLSDDSDSDYSETDNALVKKQMQTKTAKSSDQMVQTPSVHTNRVSKRELVQLLDDATPKFHHRKNKRSPYSANSSVDMTQLPRTGSGRSVKPILAWWSNERVVFNSSTDQVDIVPGSGDTMERNISSLLSLADARKKQKRKASTNKTKTVRVPASSDSEFESFDKKKSPLSYKKKGKSNQASEKQFANIIGGNQGNKLRGRKLSEKFHASEGSGRDSSSSSKGGQKGRKPSKKTGGKNAKLPHNAIKEQARQELLAAGEHLAAGERKAGKKATSAAKHVSQTNNIVTIKDIMKNPTKTNIQVLNSQLSLSRGRVNNDKKSDRIEKKPTTQRNARKCRRVTDRRLKECLVDPQATDDSSSCNDSRNNDGATNLRLKKFSSHDSLTKHNSTTQKRTRTRSADHLKETDNSNKIVGLTGKVGTMKRKRQLREMMDQHNKGCEDNLIDSTPFKKRKKVQVHLDDSDEEWDMPSTATSGRNFQTPATRHRQFKPMSETKTPMTSFISPGVLHSVNRNAVDLYTNRFKKAPRVRNILTKSKPASSPATSKNLDGLQTSQLFDVATLSDRDSDEEEDYYWSDA